MVSSRLLGWVERRVRRTDWIQRVSRSDGRSLLVSRSTRKRGSRCVVCRALVVNASGACSKMRSSCSPQTTEQRPLLNKRNPEKSTIPSPPAPLIQLQQNGRIVRHRRFQQPIFRDRMYTKAQRRNGCGQWSCKVSLVSTGPTAGRETGFSEGGVLGWQFGNKGGDELVNTGWIIWRVWLVSQDGVQQPGIATL